MTDSRAKTLNEHADHLFEKKRPLDSLLQEIADHFYPERGDFTVSRSLGSEFAAHLTTSYPLLARRELGNAFGSMLRPDGQGWFHIGLAREDREDNAGKRWLEWASGLQRRAMYDRVAQFKRATSTADHDFAAFGQCVISAELNRTASALLYRCWHLRDMAWCENHEGAIGARHRKWQPTARQLAGEFKGKLHTKVVDLLDKTPYATVNCRHAIIPADEYDAPSNKADYESPKPGVRKWKAPYISIYYDADNQHVMEEVPTHNPVYVIPRWVLTASQYAYSPATVAALPDARLIQAMTLTLLEAGEKAANPPLVAKRNILREDMNYFAGGLTYVDLEEDERIQDALQLLVNDRSGIPLGMEMREDIKKLIGEAFFLNKLNMPIPQGDGTAYEISQLVQEYIRNALPLFGPMEPEYNGALCDQTFDILLRAGAFGSPEDMPQSLRGQDIQFRFESPLHEAIEKQKLQTWSQTRVVLTDAVSIDPSAVAMVDARTALRDVLSGIRTPAKWLRDDEQMDQMALEAKQRQQAQETLALLSQGGQAAAEVGKGAAALQQMQGAG